MNDSDASWTEYRLLILNELKRIDAATGELLREIKELRAEQNELKKSVASLRAGAAAFGFAAGLLATMLGYLFP
jgi:hypothetical protein